MSTTVAARISHDQQAEIEEKGEKLTRQDQLVTGDRSSDNGLLG
jgi:hypothetical protein